MIFPDQIDLERNPNSLSDQMLKKIKVYTELLFVDSEVFSWTIESQHDHDADCNAVKTSNWEVSWVIDDYYNNPKETK